MQKISPDSTKNNIVINYVPSGSEKKRSIMMYLFLGIMVGLTKKDINIFEYYHLKQASGRWILFLFILVFDAVLLFIPVIKYLGLIPLIILLVVWVISIKQARDGKYFVNEKDSPLALFSGLGVWFLDLFELNINVSGTKKTDIEIDINNK